MSHIRRAECRLQLSMGSSHIIRYMGNKYQASRLHRKDSPPLKHLDTCLRKDACKMADPSGLLPILSRALSNERTRGPNTPSHPQLRGTSFHVTLPILWHTLNRIFCDDMACAMRSICRNMKERMKTISTEKAIFGSSECD